MMCPQCKQPIDGIQAKAFAVAWCRQDVHAACLPLHVRACKPCRVHNEPYIATQEGKT